MFWDFLIALITSHNFCFNFSYYTKIPHEKAYSSLEKRVATRKERERERERERGERRQRQRQRETVRERQRDTLRMRDHREVYQGKATRKILQQVFS
jgi:hypothetical protein